MTRDREPPFCSAQQASAAREFLLDRYRVHLLAGVTEALAPFVPAGDTRLQRRVAIKHIVRAPRLPARALQLLTGLLSTEARTAFCWLVNIVTVHDFGLKSDYAYLVMGLLTASVYQALGSR